jgi:hypothetical protein
LVATAGLAVGVLAFAWPFSAGAAVPAPLPGIAAPGLTAGPVVTDAGLVWQSSTAIELTDAAGNSTRLASVVGTPAMGAFDDAWFGLGWWVLVRPWGVFSGPIGGTLRKLSLLQRCHANLYALSGEQLFAALAGGCSAGHTSRGALVEIDLRTHRWRVLAPLPGESASLAASGSFVALAYWRQGGEASRASRARLFVRVFDAQTGALVNQIAQPASVPSFALIGNVQVDPSGDVLVTTEPPAEPVGGGPGPPSLEDWWWAKPKATVAHLLFDDLRGAHAELSDRRVAFFSGQSITVMDLHSGSTRPIATFPGTATPSYFAISGNELAWAQQSSVLTCTAAGSLITSTRVLLTPTQLVGIDLRSIGSAPLVIDGAPIPPQYANEPPCVIP